MLQTQDIGDILPPNGVHFFARCLKLVDDWGVKSLGFVVVVELHDFLFLVVEWQQNDLVHPDMALVIESVIFILLEAEIVADEFTGGCQFSRRSTTRSISPFASA